MSRVLDSLRRRQKEPEDPLKVDKDLLEEYKDVYLAFGEFRFSKCVVDEIFEALTRPPSSENEVPLGLCWLDLELGPIDTFKLSSSRSWVVGWISVSLSGNGYLYPWKLKELVQRAEGSAKLQGLLQVCRRTWPVKAERPGLLTLLRRARMKDLWPYDTLSRRWDWYWGLAESG